MAHFLKKAIFNQLEELFQTIAYCSIQKTILIQGQSSVGTAMSPLSLAALSRSTTTQSTAAATSSRHFSPCLLCQCVCSIVFLSYTKKYFCFVPVILTNIFLRIGNYREQAFWCMATYKNANPQTNLVIAHNKMHQFIASECKLKEVSFV